MKQVAFTQMKDGTREEYQFLDALYRAHAGGVPEALLSMLRTLEGPKLGYRIDRFQHSLQTATRALREGADEETVVCALLHDAADVIAPANHSEVIGAILKPYISQRNHWVLTHHGAFQAYYYAHHLDGDRHALERWRGHAHFDACVDFCERWDQSSFDDAYDTLPLETFRPMVQRVLAEPRAGYV